jgi:threonine/homoserine/homoserine lactone efflux protein
MDPSASGVLAGLGLGIALAGAPGPVQAVLLAEAVRGGVARGLRAQAGAALTFGALLVALALGLSLTPPGGVALRVLTLAGGAFLLWLALDGWRSAGRVSEDDRGRRSLPPIARGSLSVLLNAGAWLFMAAVASPLLAGAARTGDTGTALLVALALLAGTALGDTGVVLLGGLGIRRAGQRVERRVRLALAVVLAAIGIWLLVNGVMGDG